MGTRRTGGRIAVGGGGSPHQEGLLVLLAGLFLLVLLAMLVMWSIGDDEDNRQDADRSSGGAAEVGELTAGDTKILPGASDRASSHVGKGAVGRTLTVTSVNPNEGFFVGPPAHPIYIEWGGDVGENGPPRFQPKKGQKVNLAGPVQRVGLKELATLGLPRSDDNRVLSQGAYVNAKKVTPAG